LVKAGKPGTYHLIDKNIKPTTTGRQILATIIITGDEKQMALPTEAKLAPLAPFKPIENNEITGLQNVQLSIETRGSSINPNLPTLFQVDNRSMGPMDSPRYLPLNGVEEWKLTTTLGTHPFHIHVNPFLVTRVVTIKQVAVQNTTTGKWEVKTTPEDDPNFKPTWHDTFAVTQGQEVYFRTRYTRYIGQFVLHCHILDHEDEGMMQLLEVVNNPVMNHSMTTMSKM